MLPHLLCGGEKMTKNAKIYVATLALLLTAVLMVSIAAAAPATFSNIAASKASEVSAGNTATSPQSTVTPTSPTTSSTQTSTSGTSASSTTSSSAASDIAEKLKAEVPKSLADTQASIVPVKTKYLMYTADGNHIMWGIYGNGRFTGTDNNGKQCWGIYENGVFAGFYDGTLFTGKYSNGAWSAQNLFGLNTCSGKYVLFPSPVASVTSAAP
jgi:hypothetical protein